MKIWKYILDSRMQIQLIEVPRGSVPISLIEQEGKIVVYFEIPDDDFLTQERKIQVIGTGDYLDIEYGAKFIGTCKIKDNEVYHVYDLGVKT